MTTKARYQNPVVGDTIALNLFVFNQNNLANVESIEKVEVYKIGPNYKPPTCSDKTLVQSFEGDQVVETSTGVYLLDVPTVAPTYTIGRYVDVWTVKFESEETTTEITNVFTIYPDLWYTSPIPVVYDFAFSFRPNRLRKGSIQYLIIQVIPNVPTGTDLERYYYNLAVLGNVSVNIKQRSGPCMPEEPELRWVVENQPASYREKQFGYYQLDTTEMEIGIYDVWFQLDIGSNTYISDTQTLQIYQ